MLVGIDLGTTHSLVAYFDQNGPTLIPNSLGEYLTPSIVSIDSQGQVLVGRAAKDHLITHPNQAIAAFKRWMGTSRETRLGKGQYRPEQLSALVLKSLLEDAQNYLGVAITEAVISVPAYFSDAQRKATRLAGEMAGIKVERLINEPTAAALAYGLQQRDQESRFVVFDLGGGTLDISVLEMFEGVVEVKASTGDNWLGGEDFLACLINLFEQQCLKGPLADQSLATQAQVRRKLEQIKLQLSSQPSAGASINVDQQTINWEVSAEAFQIAAEPLLQRLRTPLERAMRDAKLNPSDIDHVVMVGGATRMPMVTQLVTRMMGRLPLRHLNPDHTIALGAAIAAGMKARHEQLDEIVMTDVCPYTLGTNISQEVAPGRFEAGYFHPIIPRNTTVPVSREELFSPISDDQDKVVVEVYQGESPWVKNNIVLGTLNVDLPPKWQEKAERGIKVRFTYDVNGLLQVEATSMGTQVTTELIILQNQNSMSPHEVRERVTALASLKIHPRDQQENIAVLNRAERLYEECLEYRDHLQHAMLSFRQSIDSQNLGRIAEQRAQFSALLDRLEHG